MLHTPSLAIANWYGSDLGLIATCTSSRKGLCARRPVLAFIYFFFLTLITVIFYAKSCSSIRFPMMMAMMVATTAALNKPMIMGQRDALISFFLFPLSRWIIQMLFISLSWFSFSNVYIYSAFQYIYIFCLSSSLQQSFKGYAISYTEIL